MERHTMRITVLAPAVAVLLVCGSRAVTRTWDGGGADANWSTPAN